MGTASEVELRTAPKGPATACKRCREPINWATTQRGAKIPIDAGAPVQTGEASFFVSAAYVHFATCKAGLQKGGIVKGKKKSEAVLRLERQVESLRAELAESCPRDAATWAADRMREIEKQLRAAVAALRSHLTQSPADQLVAAQEVANQLETWLDEFNTRGVRPYEGAGRRVGD